MIKKLINYRKRVRMFKNILRSNPSLKNIYKFMFIELTLLLENVQTMSFDANEKNIIIYDIRRALVYLKDITLYNKNKEEELRVLFEVLIKLNNYKIL